MPDVNKREVGEKRLIFCQSVIFKYLNKCVLLKYFKYICIVNRIENPGETILLRAQAVE